MTTGGSSGSSPGGETTGTPFLSASAPNLVRLRRALLSVSDKSGLETLARGLVRLGVEIVSSGGTADALEAAGVKVERLEHVTGAPEMLGGRLKTLHPAIHGGILARRDRAEDTAELAEAGITPIDLVCVNLYPFEKTPAIEQIDIGGPALIRAAAKNHAFVTVVTAPAQYARLLEELQDHDGATTLAARRELAAAAFARTAAYDACIRDWMAAAADEAPLPPRLTVALRRSSLLRYGENPHQAAGLYAQEGTLPEGIPAARQRAGRALSYNNILDAAAALELVEDLAALGSDRAAAAIIKHANPCGAARAKGVVAAFERAYEGDPLAAYGGILALSAPIDGPVAEAIAGGQKFFEVIVAPAFSPEALATLSARWKNVRLLELGDPAPVGAVNRSLRSIPGGVLVQQPDTARPDPAAWTHAAGPAPGREALAECALAWTVVKHLKSNAIAVTRSARLVGAGCGQVDRLSACRQAIARAGERIGAGAVAASDAFFPFADGPQVLIDAGVSCLVHPGGSKRDQETLDLCAARGVTCLLTGVRHFRH